VILDPISTNRMNQNMEWRCRSFVAGFHSVISQRWPEVSSRCASEVLHGGTGLADTALEATLLEAVAHHSIR